MAESREDYPQRRQYAQPYTERQPVPTISAYEDTIQSRIHTSEPDNRVPGNAHDNGSRGGDRSMDGSGPSNQHHNNPAPQKYELSDLCECEVESLNHYSSSYNGDGMYTPTTSSYSATRTPISESEDHRDQTHQNHHHHESESFENSDIPYSMSVPNTAQNQPIPFREPPQISQVGAHDWRDTNPSSKSHPRTVTDPVTHLPVIVHDNTSDDLKRMPSPHSSHLGQSKTARVSRNNEKDAYLASLIREEMNASNAEDGTKSDATRIAIEFGLLVFCIVVIPYIITQVRTESMSMDFLIDCLFRLLQGAALGVLVGLGAGYRLSTSLTRAQQFQNDSNQRSQNNHVSEHDDAPMKPETTLWLNNTLGSIWPLINPSLFIPLFDTLEDVMQASLQNATRLPIEGVSVSDWGQGNEPLKILGIRWLEKGLGGEDRDGMEAEEGDFVNLELALSYRAQKSERSLKTKTKNAHLNVEFWWKGGLKLPIWVEIHTFIGAARVRLQLTPDPPFFAKCTLTLLGQPKVTVSCVPLTRKFFNIMDIPIISGFIQNSVNAAVAEYIAPRSLNLDLKQMIMGDDFKKDTVATGVLIVHIESARNFKDGDGTKDWLAGKKAASKVKSFLGENNKEQEETDGGTGDVYVTVGWAKFAKPITKTRIITNAHNPSWDETTMVLVGVDEVNASESLRLQLWDSDRVTTDDLLGTVEVDLHELMHDANTVGRMHNRVDKFKSIDGRESMPGEIVWSVGYFKKTKLSDEQLEKSPQVTTDTENDSQRDGSTAGKVQRLKNQITQKAKSKLREAPKDSPLIRREMEQQKNEDLKEQIDSIIVSSPPDPEFPSGILNIQIHQATGLDVAKKRNPDRGFRTTEGGGLGEEKVHGDGEGSDEEDKEEDDDLPSSYCVVVLNHTKVYKTRVKWKTSKPFYNAGLERFVRDWRNTELVIAVKDARMHENDALLGVVVLPLNRIFRDRSQISGVYPLSGGVGYGKIKLSILFRGVQAKLEPNLLGWNVGALSIDFQIKSATKLPQALSASTLLLRTSYGKGKMEPIPDSNLSAWKRKRENRMMLPVKRRFSSYFLIEFLKARTLSSLSLDHKIGAFCILWLKDIPDYECGMGPSTSEIRLPIWSLLQDGRAERKEILSMATKSCDGEYGEQLGELIVDIRFIRGLSGYHGKIAKKDQNLRDVLEILDCAGEAREIAEDPEGGNYLSDSSHSADSDDEDIQPERWIQERQESSKDKLQNDGNRGPIQDLKDYRLNKEQAHRHHQGVMQWKGVRTMKWMKDELKSKGEHVKDKVERRLKHDGGDGEWYGGDEAVESEV